MLTMSLFALIERVPAVLGEESKLDDRFPNHYTGSRILIQFCQFFIDMLAWMQHG